MINTSNLNFQFSLSGASGEITFDVIHNVKKRVESILYLQDLPEDVVKLAYVGTKELSPETNLFIADRSDSLFVNSRSATKTELYGTISPSGISVKSSNFLVTQEFIDAGTSKIPLYFKHVLPLNIIPESVKIYNKDNTKIDDSKYKLIPQEIYNEETGNPTGSYSQYYLFNSLENKYNYSTGELEIYYVHYTTVESGYADTPHIVLLSNELAYNKATYNDFWSVTLELKPWVRAYSLSEDYSLKLPLGKEYSIKYIEENKIKISYPSDKGDLDPWFVRITNGGFVNGLGGISAKYSIPEFKSQSFNPQEPYKIAARKKCFKISDRLIQFPNTNIQIGDLFIDIQIVLEKDGYTKHAITNNSTKNNTLYYDSDGQVVYYENEPIKWSSNKFINIDKFSGIVYLNIDVLDSYDIFATYHYKENYYTLNQLQLNSIYDPSLQTETRSIYIVPESIDNGNIGTQLSSIKYLKISDDGRIIYSSQNGSDGNVRNDYTTKLQSSQGYKIVGILDLHYSRMAETNLITEDPYPVEFEPGDTITVSSTYNFPSSAWLRVINSNGNYQYFKYVSKTINTFTLATNTTYTKNVPESDFLLEDGSSLELVNFIDEFTVSSSRSSSEELEKCGGSSRPNIFKQLFVLANISIIPPHRDKDSVIIDVRENGGGVREEKFEEAIVKNPEIQWTDPCIDGQLYPGKSVIVVKLPISLLQSFSLNKIKEEVNNSVPVGVYPLIRFYGYQPRIRNIYPGQDSITVEWEKEGPEFVYNIFYKIGNTGNWIQANSVRIEDDEIEDFNSYTIEDLDETKIYEIRVEMIDKYYMWYFSYDSKYSVSGGYGLDESTPVHPQVGQYTWRNIANLQFKIR